MLLNYYTRKTLTAVASTNAALSAFLQCEIWRQSFAEEDHAANQDDIRAPEGDGSSELERVVGEVVGGCKACNDQVSHLHPFSTF